MGIWKIHEKMHGDININTTPSHPMKNCSAGGPRMNELSKEVWKLNFRQYGQMEEHHSSAEAQTWRR